jgi:hypothetical protein
METLLAVITIIQRAGGKQLLLKLFSRLMVVLGLVIITAIMVSTLLIGVLINARLMLLTSGISLPFTLLLVGCAALLIITLLISVIIWQLNRLQRLPQTSPLTDMLDAFINGLMTNSSGNG